MNILNYTDFPAKLRNRTDIQDFLGKYAVVPEYLQSPDLLNNLTWSQYKLLLFFYRLTLGKQRISGTFTSEDIEHGAGIKTQEFNGTLQELITGAGKKQKEKSLPQLVTDDGQSHAKHDPIFHICSLGGHPKAGIPKKWQVTFLFPDTMRKYGKNKRKEFHPLTKLWYIGDGKNDPPVSRFFFFEPLQLFLPDGIDSMAMLLTDLTSKTLKTWKSAALFLRKELQGHPGLEESKDIELTDSVQEVFTQTGGVSAYEKKRNFKFESDEKDPCKKWFLIYTPAINEKNHLYMFTSFPYDGETLPKLHKTPKRRKNKTEK